MYVTSYLLSAKNRFPYKDHR